MPPMPPMPPIPPMPPAGVGAGVVGRSVTTASVVRDLGAQTRCNWNNKLSNGNDFVIEYEF